MDLYLMRHAHPEDGESTDASRGITKKGRKQCKVMRRFLKRIDVVPDLILCSNFKRGTETAERMAKKNHAPIIEIPELEPNGEPEKAWRAVDEAVGKDDVVLLIGHHPLIQKMAATICFSLHDHPEMFNHANILHVDTKDEKGPMHSFHWFMTTRLAKKLMRAMDDLREAEVSDAAVNLSEHLLLASRRRILAPLETKLANALERRAGNPLKFARAYQKITAQAYLAGAERGLRMLGPGKLTEVDKKKPNPLLALLPGMLKSPDTVPTGEDSSVETVALGEISDAYHTGMKDLVGLWRGANGPVEKSWDAQPDACEICLENEAEGFIDEEAPFSSGEFDPPAHPNCRCSISYRAAE